MKVLKITDKLPKEVMLEDGIYVGTWGGYIIELTYKGKAYELKTEDGVRGMGIKVLVTIKGGVADFEEVKN